MSTNINETTPVRDLVGRYPNTRPVFERHGIDYCCGGGKSLAEAAAASQAAFPDLLRELEEAFAVPAPARGSSEKNWYGEPLAKLVDHILQAHHAYMKTALPRLRGLIPKVLRAHGERHGAMLRRIQDLFNALDAEITSHLWKEEEVLFPFIVAAEAHRCGRAPPPAACFGSVGNPIRQMEAEHEMAGETLARIRELTGNYILPDDACPSFRAMYEELERMEKDLHQHIHLENNILFPRAIAADAKPSCTVRLGDL